MELNFIIVDDYFQFSFKLIWNIDTMQQRYNTTTLPWFEIKDSQNVQVMRLIC